MELSTRNGHKTATPAELLAASYKVLTALGIRLCYCQYLSTPQERQFTVSRTEFQGLPDPTEQKKQEC
ncbi:hypothetical protein DV515_00014193 [Chloebia gouldiae]|uniref:Uncharacterized protein n=1 Tax=Chloebia gouldiae TaxID=44316 RepID=A0A3L8S078_CHLGU|nr:hypothetical protein DV515_00014193 [Chloebia gouldiae]